MTEILTDELLDNIGEMYRAYVEDMKTLDDEENIVPFETYLSMVMNHRSNKRRKAVLHLVK